MKFIKWFIQASEKSMWYRLIVPFWIIGLVLVIRYNYVTGWAWDSFIFWLLVMPMIMILIYFLHYKKQKKRSESADR